MKLTKSEAKKLTKALKLVIEANNLINELRNSNESFLYSSNSNILSNRIEGSVSVLENYTSQIIS